MSDKKKIEVGMGQKGQPPADATLIELAKPSEEGEVGGRGYWENVICPHCWAANMIVEEPAYLQWYTCWNCRNPFSY